MQQKLKTIIIDIAPIGLTIDEMNHRMTELESLVSTFGGVTIVKKVQKRHTPDYKTFVWTGKLDEIIAIGGELGAELLIIGNILKPAQVWNINEYLRKADSKMQAWDRVDLILKIFALHAVSPESKLQIELASIKHMGPRIFGMGMELSRQGGGSRNAKWQGETNTEIMKRHLKEKEREILEKLKTYERTRSLHRENRKRKQLPTIGIVGYTNAWKSTLFNALTSKWVLAEDKLFATLWTSVWKVFLGIQWGNEWNFRQKELLLNDTIGFIRDLPPDLIAAFKSTLEDSISADILLHIVDGSDPWMDEKINIVNTTLDEIWANQERIIVYNKCDNMSDEYLQQLKNEWKIIISAYKNIWIEELKQFLENKFFS